MLTVPEAFAAATRTREGSAGARWLCTLPALVDRLQRAWELEADGEVLHGYVALVVPVRRVGGRPAVLEVSWLDEETRDEALALSWWGGVGAVTLLASAPEAGALLLDRLDAHRSLHYVREDDAVALAAAVLRRLHVAPPAGLRSTADAAVRWQEELPREWAALGRPGRSDVVAHAAAACAELVSSPGAVCLLHGDYHYGNVLAHPSGDTSAPAQWAAIDPKPHAGDREFDLVPLLRNRWDELAATGDAGRACRRRLDALVEQAGLERDRARAMVPGACRR